MGRQPGAEAGMSWVIAAHRCELAAPGDYVLLPWAADGELAVANMAGHVVAFDNRCPHRGARIYTEPAGNREPRCGYHGRVATAAGVRRYSHGWVGDWLVVDRGDATGPIPDAIYDLLTHTPGLRLHSTLRFTQACDWQTAVENALEAEHVPHVHAQTLGVLKLKQQALDLCADGSSVERFRAEGKNLSRLSWLFPRELFTDYLHAHLHPHTCISSTRGWTYSLQHYFPRADGQTAFWHRMYAAPTKHPAASFFKAAAAMNAKVFAEDAAICAGIPPGFAGQLGPHDARIAHFRKHLGPAHA
jgi:phenylpropionate dioxygenase-like ring-hydroxylating dioxygenase large terminal subunit